MPQAEGSEIGHPLFLLSGRITFPRMPQESCPLISMAGKTSLACAWANPRGLGLTHTLYTVPGIPLASVGFQDGSRLPPHLPPLKSCVWMEPFSASSASGTLKGKLPEGLDDLLRKGEWEASESSFSSREQGKTWSPQEVNSFLGWFLLLVYC